MKIKKTREATQAEDPEKMNTENKQVMVALLKAQEESKALLVEKSRADTLLIESNHAKEEAAREKAAKEVAEATGAPLVRLHAEAVEILV